MAKLSSFLGTGKNKRITAHRHVCATLGLDTTGLAPEIKQRILTFVGKDKDKDSKVRELVTKFIEDAENDGESTSQSQDIFSQNSYRTSSASDVFHSVSESDDENDEDDKNDDDENDEDDEHEDDTIPKEKTSTPLRPARINPSKTPTEILTSKLTEKIQSWIGKDGTHENNDNRSTEAADAISDAIEVIETSFAAMNVNEGLAVDSDTNKTPPTEESQHTSSPKSFIPILSP